MRHDKLEKEMNLMLLLTENHRYEVDAICDRIGISRRMLYYYLESFRALWIQRINAAARLEDLSYSKLMGLIHKAGIQINRKVLADLAMNNPAAFKAIVDKVKNA